MDKLDELIVKEASYIEDLMIGNQIGGDVAECTRALAELVKAKTLVNSDSNDFDSATTAERISQAVQVALSKRFPAIQY